MLGPDGINLGPLTLSWNSLTLLLGLLTWFSLTRFAAAERATLVTLLIARLWAAIPGLDSSRPLLDNLLDIVDIRRGGWAWLPGLAAGLLTLWWPARKFPPGLARPLLLTLLLGALPQLLRPSAQAAQVPFPDIRLPKLVSAQTQGDQPLPRGGVVNFWATWCPPCRAELPLLESAAQQGEPVYLVNVGEDTATVTTFMQQQQLKTPTWLKGENLTGTLNVRAFPTTLAVNAQGRIVARHLGPLSAAQLQDLLKQAKGNP